MFKLEEVSTHEITVLIDPTKIDYGATDIARAAQLDAVRQIAENMKTILDKLTITNIDFLVLYNDLQSYLDTHKK